MEKNRSALIALRANIELVGLGGEIRATSVELFLEGEPGQFDLAFVDPLYALSLPSVETVLALVEPGLAPGAIVVLHRPSGEQAPGVPDTLARTDRRSYGGTGLWRYAKIEEDL